MLLAMAPARHAASGEPVIKQVTHVIEMFTSQGCSSCPPAERLLARLADEPGILALAYHVDYWDYIGWRDTFGSAANTERQRAYAKSFDTTTIYTPQAVVNGQAAVVGSHEAKLRRLIANGKLSDHAAAAKVDLAVMADRLHITASGSAADTGGQTPVLMLVTFVDDAPVAIDRGENRGHTMTNTHAVKDWRILGMWTGETMEIDLPLVTLFGPDARKAGCAAILQSVTADGAPGEILAAAQLEFPGE
jgi:hypothetical protein